MVGSDVGINLASITYSLLLISVESFKLKFEIEGVFPLFSPLIIDNRLLIYQKIRSELIQIMTNPEILPAKKLLTANQELPEFIKEQIQQPDFIKDKK